MYGGVAVEAEASMRVLLRLMILYNMLCFSMIMMGVELDERRVWRVVNT